jgi:hypothetical protein
VGPDFGFFFSFELDVLLLVVAVVVLVVEELFVSLGEDFPPQPASGKATNVEANSVSMAARGVRLMG